MAARDLVAGFEQGAASESTAARTAQALGATAVRSKALGPDEGYTSEQPVETAFLVYRAQLRVPVIQGYVSRTSHRPTAELHIWSSSERLRAKFVGNAWPVANGSEVRLRADRPGAVVVDEHGLRPLGPGQLAHWFAGTSLTQRLQTTVSVATVSDKEAGGPRHLLCELLAEWANQPRPVLSGRCTIAGPNPRLRIGRWWATRTVSMYQMLPKRRLRTDMPLTEPVPADFQAIQARQDAGRQVRNYYSKRLLPFSDGQPWGWFGPSETVGGAPCLKNVRAAVDAFGTSLRVGALRSDSETGCFEAFAPRPLEQQPLGEQPLEARAAKPSPSALKSAGATHDAKEEAVGRDVELGGNASDGNMER